MVEWKHPWRYRLTVRTEPSQGLNTGSIPVSATTNKRLTGRRAARGSTRTEPAEKLPLSRPILDSVDTHILPEVPLHLLEQQSRLCTVLCGRRLAMFVPTPPCIRSATDVRLPNCPKGTSRSFAFLLQRVARLPAQWTFGCSRAYKNIPPPAWRHAGAATRCVHVPILAIDLGNGLGRAALLGVIEPQDVRLRLHQIHRISRVFFSVRYTGVNGNEANARGALPAL